jgi:hypothetical protein
MERTNKTDEEDKVRKKEKKEQRGQKVKGSTSGDGTSTWDCLDVQVPNTSHVEAGPPMMKATG